MSSTELTARARILRAAIRRVAADGMGAALRSIAADASVSAGLILHHFGSREGLLSACDHEVLAITREAKSSVMAQGAAAMLVQLAQRDQYAPVVGYVLRRLQAGGPMAAQLVEDFVQDSVQYLHEGERSGLIRPSTDPEARARVLTEMGLGALLLQLPSHGEALDLEDLPRWLQQYSERLIGPMLELFTHPLLQDTTLLDAYRTAGGDS